MTDLDIAQLEKKIQQLPPQLAVEVNDYVDFLLQKYQARLSETQLPSDAEIEAVCGLYQAECFVSLEDMEKAIIQGALRGCD